jgi:glycolate oxidase
MIGSEGTLGIVTKAIVKITKKFEAVKTFLASFNSIDDASNAVSGMIARGIIPAGLEMMDRVAVGAIEKFGHAGYPEDAEAVLLIELDGLKEEVDALEPPVIDECKKHGARDVRIARSEEERMKLWVGRKSAGGAFGVLKPNYFVEDCTVPRSKLPEALRRVKLIGSKYGLTIANLSHAGDGNLHPCILYDSRNETEKQTVLRAGLEIAKQLLDLGGTISGEHGIGIAKLELMPLAFSKSDFSAMAKIKASFDRDNLSNPGKVVSPSGPVSVGKPG